jgi:hypothetical protein
MTTDRERGELCFGAAAPLPFGRSTRTTSTILHYAAPSEPAAPASSAPAPRSSAPAPAPKVPTPMTDEQLLASIVKNMSDVERTLCQATSVDPKDWARQRLHEVRTGHTSGLDTSKLPPRA